MSLYQPIKNPSLNEQFFTWTHQSGLTVYIIPKKHSSTHAVLATRYGSLDTAFKTEKDREWIELPVGTAHFLEHKMFEGKDGTDAFTRYAQTGAYGNAYTSYDRTCYLFTCTERFDENLEILLDFVSHPFFSEQTIQKEQGIIGEEIAMYDDDASWKLYQNLMRALYHEHPILHSITGTKESISRLTPELLYRCTDAFYNLHNLALVVCGDVTPEQVDAVCERVLPVHTDRQTVWRKPIKEPEEVCTPLIEDTFAISKPIAEIGFKDTPAASAADRMKVAAANAVTCTLLFSLSGDLYNRLYESGLINNDFGGGYLQEGNAAFTEVIAYCDDPNALEQAVCEELDKRRQIYFTEEEFQNAKRVVFANNLFRLDSVESTAEAFLQAWIRGYDCFDYTKYLTELTRDEAWEIFKRTIRTDRRAMSVLYPKKETSLKHKCLEHLCS